MVQAHMVEGRSRASYWIPRLEVPQDGRPPALGELDGSSRTGYQIDSSKELGMVGSEMDLANPSGMVITYHLLDNTYTIPTDILRDGGILVRDCLCRFNSLTVYQDQYMALRPD